MNWRELIKNKKLLAGVGAAAALGAFVWWRRSHDGGYGVDVAGGESGDGGRIGNPGYLNTTGTDVAAWLSEYSAGLQGQLDEFKTDIMDRLGEMPTAPTKPPTVPVPPKPPDQPKPKPKPKPKPTTRQYITVARFTSRNPPWNSTLSGIAGHYRTSVAALMRLNPSIRNANIIRTGQRIRVR
jgi:LysM domain